MCRQLWCSHASVSCSLCVRVVACVRSFLFTYIGRAVFLIFAGVCV